MEKPPKPSKKRSAPIPNNASQLTLSATINKKDTKMKTHKEKPTKSKLSTKVRTNTADAKSSNKAHPDENGGDKSPIFQTVQDQTDKNSKLASSDYGDDSLDGLSPAAWLFGDAGPRFAISATNDSPQNEKTNYVDLTTPGPQEEPSSATSPVSPRMSLIRVDEPRTAVDETQSGIPPEDFTGVWGDLTSEFESEIFTNPCNIASSATTLPLSTVNTNVPRDPNPTASILQDSKVEDSKNAALSPERTIHEAKTPMHIPVRFTMKDFEESPSTEAEESPGGWEDIDRMLMEEFKDIVNFY